MKKVYKRQTTALRSARHSDPGRGYLARRGAKGMERDMSLFLLEGAKVVNDSSGLTID